MIFAVEEKCSAADVPAGFELTLGNPGDETIVGKLTNCPSGTTPEMQVLVCSKDGKYERKPDAEQPNGGGPCTPIAGSGSNNGGSASCGYAT